jgi:hypothetical protein
MVFAEHAMPKQGKVAPFERLGFWWVNSIAQLAGPFATNAEDWSCRGHP